MTLMTDPSVRAVPAQTRPDLRRQTAASAGGARLARRALGAALILLSTLPVYRLLASPETGTAGMVTVRVMDVQLELLTAGLLLVLPVALLGALFLRPALVQRATASVAAALARPRVTTCALVLAAASCALAGAFVLLVLDGKPNHIDSIAQVLHARFWASGRLAGPADDAAFRAIQNALVTPHGWVSQYPPGHVLALTPFVLAGVPWLAGPALIAVTVFLATLLADRLWPKQPAQARLLALLVAASPFFLLLGASYMNHVTVAAATVAGAYALARAWQGAPRAAVMAGLAFGLAIATRPLAGLAIAAAVCAFLPAALGPAAGAGALVRVGTRVAAGAAVPLTALLAYNRHFFGSVTTFGYEAALGPRMRLGFGTDPWGNRYGIAEALGYTSSELMALGVQLFESAVPALLVIGVFLLVARRLEPAARLLVAWALAPVLANFFYWHHGQFMGPRMLHESAPAWAMLAGVAAIGLVRRAPQRPLLGRLNARAGVLTALAGSFALGILVLAPQRAASYGGEWLAITRAPLPAVAEPALVFVHDAWTARVGMTLAGHGYRLDVVETLLRQNSTCAVHALAVAAAAGDREAAAAQFARLDTRPRATALPPAVEIAPGDRIRVRAGEVMSNDCAREARSDREGILDLTPFAWRGDLPGARPRGPLFVRDLGPARNAALIAAHPQRRPFIYAAAGAADAILYDYDEGVRRLWGAQP